MARIIVEIIEPYSHLIGYGVYCRTSGMLIHQYVFRSIEKAEECKRRYDSESMECNKWRAGNCGDCNLEPVP